MRLRGRVGVGVLLVLVTAGIAAAAAREAGDSGQVIGFTAKSPCVEISYSGGASGCAPPAVRLDVSIEGKRVYARAVVAKNVEQC